MDQQPKTQTVVNAKDRRAAFWVVLVIGVLFTTPILSSLAYGMIASRRFLEIVLAHFPAVVGLPAGAFASLCIVMFLKHTSGAIEFEGLGFKFKGASGPIVLWVFCYLAVAASIKLLW